MTDRYNATFRISSVEAKSWVQSKQMWSHTNKKYRLNGKS